nr:putative capsid protein [Picobirnavirus sp.]
MNRNKNRNKKYQNSKGATSTGTLKEAVDESIEDTRRGKKGKGNKDYKDIDRRELPNDPDDYFTDLSLAEQAAQLSIPNVLGTTKYLQNFTMPTCMILPVNPSVGMSEFDYTDEPIEDPETHEVLYERGFYYKASNSGAFMASQKLYTLTSINSGRSNAYQQNDVLVSVLAVAEAVGMIEYARRFFGIATTYSMRNRIYAIKLLSMLGNQRANSGNFDNTKFGEDFISNMSDYRLKLNMLITKVNQIPIIANMGWLRKKIRLFQKVFLDSPTDLAQTYALTPYSTWVLDETGDKGSVLRTVHMTSAYYSGAKDYINTFNDILNVISRQVDALLNSTTLNYVYGDLLNYASKNKMEFLRVDYVQEGYSVIPEYNAFYNYMIHNADHVDPPITLSAYAGAQKQVYTNENDVVTDVTSGSFYYAPAFQFIGASEADEFAHFVQIGGTKINPVLDLANNNPSLAEKIDYTKFKITYDVHYVDQIGENTDVYVQANALPDHYIVSPIIYFNDANSFMALGHDILQSAADGKFIESGWHSISERANLPYVYDPNFSEELFVASVLDKWGTATPLRTKSAMLPGTAIASDVGVKHILGECDFVTDIPYDRFTILTDLEYQGLLEFRG